MSTTITDAELSRIYRSAFEAHPARTTDPALALASAADVLRDAMPLGRTGMLDEGALTWTSDPAVAPLPAELIAAARLLIEGLPDTEVTDARADALYALEALLADEPG